MGLLRRLFDSFQLTPTFAELEQQNHDAAASLTREQVLDTLERSYLHDPATRDELRQLLHTRPFDAAAEARYRALTGTANPTFVRPGTVEELWYLDGLLTRLRSLDADIP